MLRVLPLSMYNIGGNMPSYNDRGVITDQAKQNTDVITVNNAQEPLNIYMRHGMIIRDLDTGKNWKLKVAIEEQTITGDLDKASDSGMLLTPAI